MSKKILIVDDDPDICAFISTVLDAAGYVTETLRTANFIVEAVIKSAPDLVLPDYHLPGVDGIMALNTLRSNKLLMPIVMLTVDASQQVAVASFRSGATDFLPKPCKADYLESVVSRAFKTREKDMGEAAHNLMDYLSHKPDCYGDETGECSCGLNDIVSELLPVTAAPNK